MVLDKINLDRSLLTMWNYRLFAHSGLTQEAQKFVRQHGILWSTREQLDELLVLLGLRPLPNLDDAA